MSKIPRIPAKKALLVATVLAVVGAGAGYYLTQMSNDLPPPPPMPAPVAEAPLVTPPVSAVVSSAEASVAFESEKAAGTLGFATTQTLANAYMAEKNPDKALETYDTYLATKPDDVAAIDARAQVLLALGREDEYKVALVKLAELEPNEARLTALSGYLNSKQFYAEQLSVLQKLNEVTGKQKPEVMLSIADVAVAAKDDAAALQAFTDYLALPNATMDSAHAVQYVRLLALAKRQDDALAYATAWAKVQPDGSNNVVLASALLYNGAPIQAIAFIDVVKPADAAAMPADLKKISAEAYAAQGEYAKALPLFKELRASAVDGEYEESYFVALANVAKTDDAARDELRTLVKDQFESGKLTDAQKMDRVYALLNAGDKVMAMEYAEHGMQTAADDTKEKWSQLYNSLTAAPAKRLAGKAPKAAKTAKASSDDETAKPVARAASSKRIGHSATAKAAMPAPSVALDKRIALATRPGMSDAFLRATAFDALNAGRKQDAVKLFAQLAVKNGPKSSDAEQLMYVLGARVGQQEMAWLTSAAKQSKGENRTGWIEVIASAAPAEGIVAAAELNPDWLNVLAFSQRYASSLQQLGQADQLDRYKQVRGVQATSADAMVNQAAVAFTNRNPAEGERLLNAAASAPDATRRTHISVAELNLQRARYVEASSALATAGRTNSAGRDAVDSAREAVAINYYQATLAHRDGDDTQAQAYYQAALKAGEGQQFDDRGTQEKIYASQMALGMIDPARRGFEGLMKQNPQDETLLADYIAALLEQKRHSDARAVAATYGGGIKPGVRAVAPVAMDVSGVLQVPADALTTIQPMSGGHELKLQFNRPLPAHFVPGGASPKPAWLSYYTVSYDSIVIAAAPGYSLRSDGATVSAVADNAAAPMVADNRQGYLRLQLLYARTELESNEVDQALNRLNALGADYADAPEYKAYQANAEFYAANPKRALKLVKDAQRLDPQNEDIARMRRNIERFHAEHLKLDHEWYKLGSAKQNLSTLEARVQYTDDVEATLKLQTNHIKTGVIRRTQGAAREFSGNKFRAELEMAKMVDDSSVVAASVFGNQDTGGGALSYQSVNLLGTTQVYGEYHKPYWDLPEAVVADTVRDRVGASHWWKPDPDFTVRAEGAYNRYSVDVKENIADSVSARANVLYTLQDLQPYVALSYNFNGEYLRGRVKRNSFAGSTFKYLPLRSREVHSLTAVVSHDFDVQTNGEMELGYAIDRLGDQGPIAEGRLTHNLADDFDIQLRGRYGFEEENASKHNASSLGGYARWTW